MGTVVCVYVVLKNRFGSRQSPRMVCKKEECYRRKERKEIYLNKRYKSNPGKINLCVDIHPAVPWWRWGRILAGYNANPGNQIFSLGDRKISIFYIKNALSSEIYCLWTYQTLMVCSSLLPAEKRTFFRAQHKIRISLIITTFISVLIQAALDVIFKSV